MRNRWCVAVVGALLLMGCQRGDPSAGSARDHDPDPARIGPQGRVAQFIVQCTVSHIDFDDPIVLPGQPGASHQHQFFGNAATTADPDYERMLDAETSCDQPLDTAAYWSPTLLDPDGRVIPADSLTAYYRPGNGVDPADVVAYPPGFMMVAGRGPADPSPGHEVIAWSCGSSAARGDTPPACPPDTTLRLVITFPDCWDESRQTSFGSAAYVRYSDDGCPATHPVPIPQLQMAIDYPPVDPEGLSFSSGPIDSAHADFWNTWNQTKLEREVVVCLNRNLVCGVSG